MHIQNVMVVSGAASFSTRDVWDGYCEALAHIGVGVVPYPTFSMLRMLSPELVGNDIIGKALDVRNGIDAVIFVDGLYFRDQRRWVVESLTRAGMLTMMIATDDPYDVVRDAERVYSLCFTNEVCSKTRNVRYLPTATPLPPSISFGRHKYDVTFIGTIFEDRWPILKQLADYCEKKRLRCLIAGTRLVDCDELANYESVTFRPEAISSEAKRKFYARSKVVLNLFRETDQPAESPSPRVFEVTAMGGPALLSGRRRAEVSRIFRDAVYEFDDFESLCFQLERALTEEEERKMKAAQAKEITLQGHLYRHRAQSLLDACKALENANPSTFPEEDRLCWVFGAARTGSTWLIEMLGDVTGVHVWHEPLFGKMFLFPHEHRQELARAQSFFAASSQRIWLEGMRRTFTAMAEQRFARVNPSDALIVKEVNAPEICPHLQTMFPRCKFLLLVRDPFDILDSHLDMQRPGGWNEDYAGEELSPHEKAKVSCVNIRRAMKLAISAYERFPESRRLMVRYEDLLNDPATWIQRCATLVGVDVSADQALRIAEQHRFEKHTETGQLKHRRFGKAGVWRSSENFTSEMLHLAEEMLGGLRTRLEYEN